MWHDLGSAVGLTGWLVMGLVMLAFWSTVVCGLWALFQFPWTTDRREPHTPNVGCASSSGAEPREPR